MAKTQITNVTVNSKINTVYVTYSTGTEKLYPADKLPKTVQAWLEKHPAEDKEDVEYPEEPVEIILEDITENPEYFDTLIPPRVENPDEANEGAEISAPDEEPEKDYGEKQKDVNKAVMMPVATHGGLIWDLTTLALILIRYGILALALAVHGVAVAYNCMLPVVRTAIIDTAAAIEELTSWAMDWVDLARLGFLAIQARTI